MLTNPVLKREFITSLRTSRAIVLGLVFMGFLSALVMLMWPAGGVYSVAAQQSHRLFILLSLSFLALVVISAPSFTAVSITNEKERETYELLYDTLLRPDEIVLGKLSAGVGYVLILVVASLPMMGACLLLGGVSATDVLQVYLIVILAAIFFGLLGLYCSAIFRSSYRALILCYVFIVSICGITWVPSVVMGTKLFLVNELHLLRSLSPFAAMMSVVSPDFFAGEHKAGITPYGQFTDSMWSFVILAVMGGLVLLGLSLRRIANPPQPKRRNDNQLVEDRIQLLKRHVSFPFYLLDPRKRKRQIGGILNVIAVKEMRSKAFARSVWLIRSIYLCFTVSLLLAFLPLTQISSSESHIDIIIFTCIALPLAIIIFIGPVMTASAITDEQESGVFDMLRCTRISARALVLGKLEVAWFFTILLLLSTFPTFFILAYVSSDPTDMEAISTGLNFIRPPNFQFAEGWEKLQGVNIGFLQKMGAAFLVVMHAMLYTTIAGICASTFCKRSSTATAIAYGATLGWALLTMVPAFLSDTLPAWLVGGTLSLNPFAAAAKAAAAGGIFKNQPADLWYTHLMMMDGLCAILLIVTIVKVYTMMRPQR